MASANRVTFLYVGVSLVRYILRSLRPIWNSIRFAPLERTETEEVGSSPPVGAYDEVFQLINVIV